MKIRTSLYLIILFTLAGFIGFLYANYRWAVQSERMNELASLTKKLSFSIFEKSQARDEYFLYREIWAKDEWLSLQEEINKLLEELSGKMTEAADRDSLNKIIAGHNRAEALFASLLRHEQTSAGNNTLGREE